MPQSKVCRKCQDREQTRQKNTKYPGFCETCRHPLEVVDLLIDFDMDSPENRARPWCRECRKKGEMTPVEKSANNRRDYCSPCARFRSSRQGRTQRQKEEEEGKSSQGPNVLKKVDLAKTRHGQRILMSLGRNLISETSPTLPPVVHPVAICPARKMLSQDLCRLILSTQEV